MKLGLVTKLVKRNMTTSNKFDKDVMSENCDIFLIYVTFFSFHTIALSKGTVFDKKC